MSGEQHGTQYVLVPSVAGGLTARSPSLVRRGLDTLWEMYNNAGIEAYEQGRFANAERLFSTALRETDNFSPQDSRRARSLHNMANAYCQQGKYAGVESLYEQALQLGEQSLGSEHPMLAIVLVNLASFHWGQYDHATAKSCFWRALTIRENSLGQEHPDITRIVLCLASLHQIQGEYAEAERLFQQALSIFEKAFGTKHQLVVNTIYTLRGLR
jgi:tetratricopeptide (TPR) repeat protein